MTASFVTFISLHTISNIHNKIKTTWYALFTYW